MFYTVSENKRKYRFKVNIEKMLLDTVEMKKLFLAIKEFKKTVGNFPKDSPENVYIRNQIKFLRAELKLYAYMAYKLVVSLGKNTIYEVFSEMPNKENIKALANNLRTKVTKKTRLTFPEKHEMMGFHYELMGGVFTKPGCILELQNSMNNKTRIHTPKKPHAKLKAHYVGIELELISALTRDALETLFIDAKLSGNVYIKDDSSIQKEERTETAHEVTVLCKQLDYKEIVKRVCAVINSPTAASYVNNSCGMHVHFDVRNRIPDKVFMNLVRILPLLKQLVPSTRVDTQHAKQYCALNKTDIMRESTHPDGNSNRYQAINPESARKYSTIEVRIHSGTTNAAKIINWIETCLYAVDAPEVIPYIESLSRLQSLFTVTSKLAEYITRRIKLFAENKKGCDTRSDHFFITEEVA